MGSVRPSVAFGTVAGRAYLGGLGPAAPLRLLVAPPAGRGGRLLPLPAAFSPAAALLPPAGGTEAPFNTRTAK